VIVKGTKVIGEWRDPLMPGYCMLSSPTTPHAERVIWRLWNHHSGTGISDDDQP
jgi:hypothetical protein